MNSRRRIGHASGCFIDSLSRPGMHGNGLRRRLPLVLVFEKGLFAAAHKSAIGPTRKYAAAQQVVG
jgi:hypothetical protein